MDSKTSSCNSRIISILLFTSFMISLNCGILKPQHSSDCVRAYIENSTRYANQRNIYSIIIEAESEKYVHNNKKINWNEFTEKVTEYYYTETANYLREPILKILDSDKVCELSNSPELIIIEQSILNLARKQSPFKNVHREVDSLFFQTLVENPDLKFNTELEYDCTRFKTGFFELMESKNTSFQIERTDSTEYMYSYHDDDKWLSRIEWVGNNRYYNIHPSLRFDLNSKPYDTMEVNIYLANDSSYYYISKSIKYGNYFEGYTVKKK